MYAAVGTFVSFRPAKPIHAIAYIHGSNTILPFHPQLQLGMECIDVAGMVNPFLVLAPFNLNMVSRNIPGKRTLTANRALENIKKRPRLRRAARGRRIA